MILQLSHVIQRPFHISSEPRNNIFYEERTKVRDMLGIRMDM